MNTFLHDDFFLENPVGRILFHDVAKFLPIVDYHNHLSPEDLALNRNFQNLDEAWLEGDHYKWRAMRANRIPEEFITGDVASPVRFAKWAETVPATVRNPVYIWTHLELRRYFGIDSLLTPETADSVFRTATEMLQESGFACRSLLGRMKVEIACTTDDPTDSLEWHEILAKSDFPIKVFPTYRTDRALALDATDQFNDYLDRLEAASGISITAWNDFLEALKVRHDHFDALGCRAADNGLTSMPDGANEIGNPEHAFDLVRSGKAVSPAVRDGLRHQLLVHMAEWHHARGWVQQFHLGALRNPNTRGFRSLGRDAGFDTMASPVSVERVARFLDTLDRRGRLPRTILYNLNPANNAGMATLAGSFENGKVQWGPAWWFLDQKRGIEEHLNLLSETGLVARFVGMVTDSRSFLSFPRHEYFRRVFCNLIGQDVENGLIPWDFPMLKEVVTAVCYTNAKEWFGTKNQQETS